MRDKRRLWILDAALFCLGSGLLIFHAGHGLVFEVSDTQRAFIPVSALLIAAPISRHLRKKR